MSILFFPFLRKGEKFNRVGFFLCYQGWGIELFQLSNKTTQVLPFPAAGLAYTKWRCLSDGSCWVQHCMQPLVIKIFLIQVLNFKQLCWLISNNTRQEWLHFVDKRLAAVQIYCCRSTLIKHSSAVLHPPPKSSGAISSLMCHSPGIQNPGNLTGITKCVVKLYLFFLFVVTIVDEKPFVCS